ncbi:hypothetical protein [Arthrobacter sp. 135MFCol5.1]|uniref:hypothetical protein n=1 Tax=Arthrobacter sp. 135MFCol5.1 TaxID=1158050 RepID=UPI00037F34C3|nr:hypothetical protein [Arthrobacter sp. 135MFCol5.1]
MEVQLLFVKAGDDEAPAEHVMTKDGLDLYCRYTLTLRHVDRPVSDSDIALTTQAAIRKLPSRQSRNTPLPMRCRTTLAEVRCLTDDSMDEPQEHALEQALKIVTDFQQAYHLASKEVISLVSRKSLPLVLPVVTELKNGELEFGSIVGKSQGNRGPAGRQSGTVEASTRLLTDDEEVTLRGALAMLQTGVFGEFIDVQREGYVAYRSGNTILASILLGGAAELLVKETVGMLLWEEGVELGEAKRVLGVLRTTRYLNEATPRLKNALADAWTKDMEAAYLGWREDVAKLRNASIHDGLRPTNDQVKKASTSYVRFQKSLVAAFAAKHEVYPVTASLLGAYNVVTPVGAAQLRLKIERWKFEIFRHGQELSGDLSDSVLHLLIDEASNFQWFAVDERRGVAARLPDQEPPVNISELIADMAATKKPPFHVLLQDENVPKGTDSSMLAWLPAYLAFPESQPLNFRRSL